MSGLFWFVAHTRSRCEKKLVEFCEREKIPATLPLSRSVRAYRGKKVVFHNPLFPGYVFLQLAPGEKSRIFQSDHIANLLEVVEQELFAGQLRAILAALQTDMDIRLAPGIGSGARVIIKRGPLQGVEGVVETRHGVSTVLLRLDFIGQAAAVKIDAGDLEMI